MELALKTCHCAKCPSYIRRHLRFCKAIQDLSDLPESSILVSFDVIDLYPHIPHGEGIETMAEYLETKEDKTISNKDLCDLASTVLSKYCPKEELF